MLMLTSESLNPNLVQDDPYSLSLISTDKTKRQNNIILGEKLTKVCPLQSSGLLQVMSKSPNKYFIHK